MNLRITFARNLLRLGEFIRTLPVVILRPADMLEWSRMAYNRASRDYDIQNNVDAGLSPDEMLLWERVSSRAGRILVLGGGGGREAIFFARQKWQVTAVDFSTPMLELARSNAAQRGIALEGWVCDIAQLDATASSFDAVWFSMFLYSAVLNRQRRIKMLRRIRAALKAGAYLTCSFHWDPQAQVRRKGELLRKMLTYLTLGNTGYENGDILFGSLEFRHVFASEEELRAEFAAGGFEVIYLTVFDGMMRGSALLAAQ